MFNEHFIHFTDAETRRFIYMAQQKDFALMIKAVMQTPPETWASIICACQPAATARGRKLTLYSGSPEYVAAVIDLRLDPALISKFAQHP